MKVTKFKVEFVKLYGWFVGSDRLKLYLNQGKTILPTGPLF